MTRRAMRNVVLGIVFAGTSSYAPSVLRGQEPGGVIDASHEAPATSVRDVSRTDGAFDRVAMVRELMKRRGGEPAAAAQLVQLVGELTPADAFAAYEELALAHERVGQLNLAAETRLMAVQAYPQEPAARAALLWLTRLYGSSEVAQRYRPAGQAADVDRGAALYAYQLATTVPAGDAASGRRRDEPALAYARAVAARRAGVGKAGSTLLAALKHAKAGDPWGDCARVETWLESGRAGDAPKSVMRCVRAAEGPRLDGVLDEACWASVTTPETTGEAPTAETERAEPQAAEKAPAADVRWAWDGEYLYVAVRCAKAAGVSYPQDNRGRTRDAALAAFDRVRLLVDVDRDYATYFELTVDSRGWTRDACWSDVAWNPEWFVAAGETESEWTAEAAIGLDQLGAKRVASGAAWAIAVERTLPTVGGADRAEPSARANPQPTAAPTTTLGPEEFGVLVFE